MSLSTLLELQACRVTQGCEKLERGGLLREACQLLWMRPSSPFHHSDVAVGMSGAGLKGKSLCFPAGEAQSSWLHASLCLNASIML